MTRSIHGVSLVVFGMPLFAATMFACAHKPAAPVEPAPAPVVTTPPAPEPVAAAPAEKTCSADTQCADGELCIRQRCVTITADLPECSLTRVHFDFNKTEIKSEDRPALERVARCLRADQKSQVLIEGNTDERGSEEYNLQLSSMRAGAVERYLVTLGVSETQVKTVSYGELRPLCAEKDEACFAKNRRAAVKPKVEAKAPTKK